jgi:predicted NBD/HSP70 family sugar kinase
VEVVLDYLAIAVAAVVNLYAPPLVVLHGRLLDLSPELLPRLEAKAKPRILAPFRDRYRLAKSKSSKAQGALAGILDYIFDELGPLLPGTVQPSQSLQSAESVQPAPLERR